MLMDAMSEFDARDRNCRIGKRLEAFHRSASPLDRSMVLLNDVVQVLGTPNSDSAPSRVLALQESQRPVARYMAIECDLARSSIRMQGERPPKERLRSGDASIRSQHEVYAAPLFVHSTGQIVPLALDRDVSLVNAPGTTDRAGKSIQRFSNSGTYRITHRMIVV